MFKILEFILVNHELGILNINRKYLYMQKVKCLDVKFILMTITSTNYYIKISIGIPIA